MPKLEATGIYKSALHAVPYDVLYVIGDFDDDTRTHHIHIVEFGSMQWKNYINFRVIGSEHPKHPGLIYPINYGNLLMKLLYRGRFLKWVAEIFFPWGDKPCHQLCNYYMMIYDDQVFFDGYKKLSENPAAANVIVEKPALFSLCHDFTGKLVHASPEQQVYYLCL